MSAMKVKQLFCIWRHRLKILKIFNNFMQLLVEVVSFNCGGQLSGKLNVLLQMKNCT